MIVYHQLCSYDASGPVANVPDASDLMVDNLHVHHSLDNLLAQELVEVTIDPSIAALLLERIWESVAWGNKPRNLKSPKFAASDFWSLMMRHVSLPHSHHVCDTRTMDGHATNTDTPKKGQHPSAWNTP